MVPGWCSSKALLCFFRKFGHQLNGTKGYIVFSSGCLSRVLFVKRCSIKVITQVAFGRRGISRNTKKSTSTMRKCSSLFRAERLRNNVSSTGTVNEIFILGLFHGFLHLLKLIFSLCIKISNRFFSRRKFAPSNGETFLKH